MISLAAIIIGMVLLGIGGLVLVFFSLPRFKTALKSKKWPAVEAEMISANRVKRHDDESGTYFEVHIDIKYDVDGHVYAGKIIDHQGKKDSKNLSKRINKEGGKTIVYYDPDEPSRFVQRPGIELSSLLVFLLPAILFIAGFVFLGGRIV